MLALVVTEKLASDKIKGTFTRQLCDNTNALSWVLKKRSRFPEMNALVKELVLMRNNGNYLIRSGYITSGANTKADELSRVMNIKRIHINDSEVRVWHQPLKIWLRAYFRERAHGSFF